MSYLALSGSFEYLCYWFPAFRNMFDSYSAGVDFSRQNLTSTDVRFWRIKTVPALEGLSFYHEDKRFQHFFLCQVHVFCDVNWCSIGGYCKFDKNE